MELKPQDIVVALKLCVLTGRPSYTELAKSLGISPSETHAAVRRLSEARLVDPETRVIQKTMLRNFIIHGVPIAFPAKPKEPTRGMPTAWAAPVMAGRISQAESMVPVWSSPDGKVRGVAVEPLYSSVVEASLNDQNLYDLLALVDALRLGRARERKLAEDELTKRLKGND
jgi:DNA-binding Lrp family transcriptional regulator